MSVYRTAPLFRLKDEDVDPFSPYEMLKDSTIHEERGDLDDAEDCRDIAYTLSSIRALPEAPERA